jgi:hypothetical protein
MLTFQHADLRRLYAYWSARRPQDAASSHQSGLDALPSRDDIDPVDLGWMLDRISLFECHDNPLRFRCRVAGTWYSLRFDFEANGSWLHDWPDGAMRDSVLALYRLVHADSRPRRLIRQFTIDGTATLYEGAALPLGPDRTQPADKHAAHKHTKVAMILVGAAPIANADLTGLSLIHEAGPYRSWSS